MTENTDVTAEPTAELTMEEFDSDAEAADVPVKVDEAAVPVQEGEPDVVEEPAKEQSYFDKKIGKATAEKNHHKDRADRLQQELADLRQSAQPIVSEEKSAPRLEDFDYDENRYSEARVKHLVGVELAAQSKVSSERAMARAESERSNRFIEREKAFEKEAPDYPESIKSLPAFSSDTLKAFELVENGPAVAYHLSQDGELARSIANLDPISAAIELGRVSQGLGKTEDKPVRTSSAPPPITPVKSSGGSLSKKTDEMSMDELYKKSDF